jgi:hypothetical protein
MIRRSTLFTVAVSLVFPLAALAQTPPPEKEKTSQKQPSALDKQLLEDLGGDLLEGLDLPPAAKPKQPAGGSAEPEAGKPEGPPQPGDSPKQAEPDGSKPARIRLELEEGEDVDLRGQAANPLIELGRRMKDVERLIAERNTSAATQRMQEQIVADIALLIEKIRKQQKQPAGGSSRPRNRPGQPRQDPGERESTDPAEDSESRLGSASETKVEAREFENLLKEVWGHLPERVRQQMLSGTSEEVLPKYQKLIEAYYKRLAEDAAQSP